MGGFNSGRPRGSKAKLGQLLHIKLKDVKEYFGKVQQGVMASGTMTWSNGNQVGVTYNPEGMRLSFAAEGRSYDQQINAAYTPCTYGGKGRLWMMCTCGGRTNKLYFYRMQFVCRKCTGLAYRSQALSPTDRGTNAVRRIQSKLDPKGEYEILDVPDRPKGMHLSTYDKVTDKLVEVMEKREAAFDVHLVKVMQRFTGIKDLLEGREQPKKARKPGFWG